MTLCDKSMIIDYFANLNFYQTLILCALNVSNHMRSFYKSVTRCVIHTAKCIFWVNGSEVLNELKACDHCIKGSVSKGPQAMKIPYFQRNLADFSREDWKDNRFFDHRKLVISCYACCEKNSGERVAKCTWKRRICSY